MHAVQETSSATSSLGSRDSLGKHRTDKMSGVEDVDPFICVGMALMLLLLLVINIYVFAYWSHPDVSDGSSM